MARQGKLSLQILGSIILIGTLAVLFQLNASHDIFVTLRDRGVLLFNKELSSPGFTLFNSRVSNIVRLISLEGEEIKRWIVPDPTNEGVHTAKLDQAGNLLAIVQVRSISKLTQRGEILWTKKINGHHDIVELPDQSLLTFNLNARTTSYQGEEIKAWVDVVTKLSKDGETITDYPIAHLLEPYLTEKMVRDAKEELQRNSLADIYHCNALVRVPEKLSDKIQEGDILISCRELNLLLITDPEFKEEHWSYGPGILEGQHSPSFLEDGKILVFDNRPSKRRSRVIQIDVGTKSIAWEYEGREFKDFFSKSMGGVQQLPNKNILISLAIPGEILEITPRGELAWRFRNPDYTIPLTPGKREPWQFYRAIRYSTDRFTEKKE